MARQVAAECAAIEAATGTPVVLMETRISCERKRLWLLDFSAPELRCWLL